MFRKNYSYYFLLFCFLTLGACQHSAPVTVDNDYAENSNMTTNIKPKQSESPVSSPVKTKNSQSKMIIITGGINIENERLVAEGFVAGKEDKTDITAGMVFDVLNCAGYIGQIRIFPQPDDGFEHYWQNVELVADSITPDSMEVVKRCAGNKEFPNATGTYAIYPSKPERKNFRLTKQPTEKDLKAIYDSLSPEQKKWRATKNNEREPQFYETLENDFNWASSDGDGKIDLITINGACNDIPRGELNCLKILHLVNGKWEQVARITPA